MIFLFLFYFVLKVNFTTNVKKSTTNVFVQKSQAELNCEYTKINENLVTTIKWYKNFTNTPFTSQTNVSFENGNKILRFKYLDKNLNNGLYYCEVQLFNGQSIRSEAFLVEVIESIYLNLKCVFQIMLLFLKLKSHQPL